MENFNFANNPGQPNYSAGLVNFMQGTQGMGQQPNPQQAMQQPGGPGAMQGKQGDAFGAGAMSLSDRLKAFLSQQGGQPGFNTPAGGDPSPTAIYGPGY